jgi:branched-chain amino acid transport system ATP-binding protein
VLLRVAGISKRFGGYLALDGVSCEIPAGSIHALIGPNGAGKTTFIDGISGFVPTTGQISFKGQRIDRAPAHRRARLGLGRTWQSLELFEDLSVRENLQVASERLSARRLLFDVVRPGRRWDQTDVEWALDVLGLTHLAGRMPTEISQGERKLVSVGRTLAARPDLVCMDEPAAGLDTSESGELGRRLRGIVEHGTSILLVDHDMGLVLDVCDRVYVIEFGAKIAEGTPAEIVTHEQVIAAYLGETASS